MARKTKRRISYILPPPKQTVGHRLGVNGLAVDTDRGILYSAGRDGVICVWEMNLNLRRTTADSHSRSNSRVEHPSNATTCRFNVQAHTHWINDLVLTQSGQALCSASSDNSVKIFRPHALDGALPQPLGFHHDYVKALAAPDRHAQWIAAGGLDRKIRVWDLNGAGKVAEFSVVAEDENAEKGSVYALTANPYVVVSGGPENVVKVWDPRSGTRVRTFRGHTDNIRSLLISNNSEIIMSASSDQTVKVWSMATGRCLHNLTMHDDSVWSLYSDRPDLTVFYSGDRSGVVAKTDTRVVDDLDNGLCIALCHEQEGVNKIVSAGEYVWTGTANSTISRWADVDMSVGVELPDALRSLRFSSTSKNRFSLSSQFSYQTSSQNTHDKIPLQSVLRLSPTSIFPPLPSRERTRISIYSAARKSSTSAAFDAEMPALPYRDLPLETTQGSDGLIKHRTLPDRKRVLTVDTAGEVLLWDLIGCVPIRSFGKRHLEDVAAELEPLPPAQEWCTVETKIGIICCVLEERHCFDAETYCDTLSEFQGLDYREDQRVNFGKWLLRYLFSGVIDNALQEDQQYIAQLESNSPMAALTLPESVTNGFGFALNQSALPTPNASTAAHRAIATPGIRAIGTGVGLRAQKENSTRPVSIAGSALSHDSSKRKSTEVTEDYFSSRRSQAGEGSEVGDVPTSPSEAMSATSPLGSPTLEALQSREGGGSKRWRMFGSKRQPKTPLAEALVPPAVPEVKSPTENEQNIAEEARILEQYGGTMKAVIAKLRFEYGKTTRKGETVKSLIAPSLPTDTPLLRLPQSIIVLIQEEQADSGGANDIFEGTVADMSRNAHLIEDVAPEWLGDLLLLNRLPPTVNIKKITFTLKPFEGKLPEIVNEQDTDRLNANHLLRARKILGYVAEKLQPKATHEELADPKPEDYLELYCQDKPIPLKMTLAEMRREFAAGGDVQLLYKSNGRKDLSHLNQAEIMAAVSHDKRPGT